MSLKYVKCRYRYVLPANKLFAVAFYTNFRCPAFKFALSRIQYRAKSRSGASLLFILISLIEPHTVPMTFKTGKLFVEIVVLMVWN